MPCKCLDNPEQRQVVKTYAEHVVADFAHGFAPTCSEMAAYGLEQIVARLAYACVVSAEYDENTILTALDDTDFVIERVVKHLEQLSRAMPAVLREILTEARAMDGDSSVRH